MFTLSFNRTIYLGFFLAAFFLLWGLWAVPLTDIDEGAFSEATREMLVRGDYISPWLLDQPRFDKPVLIHWLQMFFVTIFGFNEFSVRLPSALAGLIWIMVCTAWTIDVAKLSSRSQSQNLESDSVIDPRLNIAIMSTCIGVPIISRASTADALLNALICLSLYLIWLAMSQRDINSQAKRYIRLSAVVISLGLLTKGPIALLIPVACSFFAALVARQFNIWCRLAFDYWAWLILLGVTLPWYVLQYRAQGMPFIEGFLGFHNLGRYTSTMHGFNGDFLYYILSTSIVILPWLPRLILSLYSLIRGQHLANRSEFSLFWINPLFVVLFFSFSATKLPHYGFYGLTGIFLLMSLQSATKFRTDLIFTSSLLLVFASLPLWLMGIPDLIRDAYFQRVALFAFDELTTQKIWFFVICALAGFVGLFISITSKILLHKWSQIIAAVILAISIHHGLTPVLIQANRDSIKSAGLLIKELNIPAKTWRLTAPSLSFYAENVISDSGTPQSGDYLVLYSHLRGDLEDTLVKNQVSAEIEILMEKQGIQLVKIKEQKTIKR